MNKKNICFLSFIIMALILTWSLTVPADQSGKPAHSDKHVFELITSHPQNTTSMTKTTSENKTPEYISRTSLVSLNMDILSPDTPLSQGDLLLLDFFPDTTYIVEITSVRVNSLGVLSIRGIDPEQELETFTLSAHEGRAQADFQDLQNRRLYKISFDTDVSGHMVVDYDAEKLPRGKGLPPLRPE